MVSSHLTLKQNRNAPDFASRARTPAAALWPQPVALPLTPSIAIYGEAIWSPIDLLGRFLDETPTPATRFRVCPVLAAFTVPDVARSLTWLISASFAVAQTVNGDSCSAPPLHSVFGIWKWVVRAYAFAQIEYIRNFSFSWVPLTILTSWVSSSTAFFPTPTWYDSNND
ncbi:hypothetical protein J3R83DRAFT_9822 [Lanmaoa asiatica]|nr:hypothetical protein J3R83DRAFT_9822 [Lanmaoa asiatica]